MKNIFIVGNKVKPGCVEAAGQMETYLKGKANVVGVVLDKEVTLPEDPIDAVISLGGDGSFLNLVETVIDREIPIMGINFGRLGFLTAGLEKDFEFMLNELIEDRTEIFDRMVLEVEITSGKEKIFRRGLNDVIVSCPDICRVFTLQVKVSDEPLFKLRGDGLIISTPTGSTAHSLSAGGSLVDPRISAILLTPLASQSLASRPLVVRPNAKIEVQVSKTYGHAEVSCDGLRLTNITHEGKVEVSKSEKSIKMIQMKNFRYFQRLGEKLGWSESFLEQNNEH